MTLPPELDRLGNALTHATARAAARRAARVDRRRRIAGGLLAGLLVFAAMTPSRLGGADEPDLLRFAVTSDASAAIMCDQPRGQHFHYTDACVDHHPAPQAAR
jgi:hypothetical protein